jgi:polyferredoxin
MTQSEVPESNWKSLYKVGGVAAWVFVVYSLVTIIIFMFLSQMPETALEAFNALQENRIIGLLRLDALTVLIMPLYYLIYLCIYNGIKNDNNAYAS